MLVVLTYLDRSDSPWVYPVMGTGFFLFQTLGSAWGIVLWRTS